MTQQSKIRLLIADDHEVVRSGLKSMLVGTEIKVVAEVATGQAAVKYALENEVDVVLMDVRMPDGDGLTALGRIKLDKPKLPILMLSAFDNPTYVARAVALGANGYLMKGCTRDELVQRDQGCGHGRERLDPRRASPRDGRPGNAAYQRRRRSPFDPARKRSAAAIGRRADEQADCRRAAHQLRDRQGACSARAPEDRRLRPHPGRGLGRAQGIGLNTAAKLAGLLGLLPVERRPHLL